MALIAETNHEIYLRESLAIFDKIITRDGDVTVIRKYMMSLKKFGESIDKEEIQALCNRVAADSIAAYEKRRNF